MAYRRPCCRLLAVLLCRGRLAASWMLVPVAITLPVGAKDIFGGGMALHASYVNFEAAGKPVEGFMRGLGGRLHFNLGRFVRIGGLGAALKTTYDGNGSFFDLGYGGISAELKYRFSRVQVSAGAAGGGGAVTHLHVDSVSAGDRMCGVYERYGTLVVTPMVTGEFFVGKTLSIAAGVDYLIGTRLGAGRTLGGPKFQAGVLFNK